MRPLLVSFFALTAAFYSWGAYHSYREEVRARGYRGPIPAEAFSHPEANLRLVREAIETNDYSDRLLVPLERSLREAPSFYQPPLLMAAFYANRFERPALIRESFEASLERFPSNGRLHLTYSEWLLTPRPTAPYRAFRAEDERTSPGEERGLALEHLGTALDLEPELTREALRMLQRFRVPEPLWADRLPPTDETLALVLETVDRAPQDPEARRNLLKDSLSRGTTLPLLRAIAYYAERWGETEIALDAAERWRRAAVDAGTSSEIVRATTTAARLHLAAGTGEKAYELLRSTVSLLQERGFPTESTLDLLCGVGDEYLNRGQAAMAQGLFSEAAATSRFHVPAFLGLARAYRASGDLVSARSELERVLKLEPSNETARRQLEEISERLFTSPER